MTDTVALSLFPSEGPAPPEDPPSEHGAGIAVASADPIVPGPEDRFNPDMDERLMALTRVVGELTCAVQTFERWQHSVDAQVALLREAALEMEEQPDTASARGETSITSRETSGTGICHRQLTRGQNITRRWPGWDRARRFRFLVKPIGWEVHHDRFVIVGAAVMIFCLGFFYRLSSGGLSPVDRQPVTLSVEAIAAPLVTTSISVPAVEEMRVMPSSNRPAPPRPSTTRFQGTLRVQSEPHDASVFLNQRFVGKTPLQLPRLRAGSYALWVEAEGYQRWTAGILVPADKVTRINAELEPSTR